MRREFFHPKSKDNIINGMVIKYIELSDEQLKHVSGGYIVAGPQGHLDWQQRQHYAHTHPGRAVPLFEFHSPSTVSPIS